MRCPGSNAWAVEFNQLTIEQICLFDHFLGCKIAPSLLKRVDPTVMNALRLVSVKETIDEKEIDLAAEILGRASKPSRELFWSLFVRNEQEHPLTWINGRTQDLGKKIIPLINKIHDYGAYALWGMRASHPGACPAPDLSYGWHKTMTPLATSSTAGLGTGSIVDVIVKTRLEHNAWAITFRAGSTKETCSASNLHHLIVFPCELARMY